MFNHLTDSEIEALVTLTADRIREYGDPLTLSEYGKLAWENDVQRYKDLRREQGIRFARA